MSLSSEQKSFIKKSYKKNQSVKKISAKIKAAPDEVKEYIDSLEPVISPQKKAFYRFILFLMPFIFFILTEIILRLFNYGGELRLFISPGAEYAKFKMCNPYVGRRYFINQAQVPDPSHDLFLKEKPFNGYRIFVLGGSSAAGYPYNENLLFSRILQKRLADAFPEKYIEVVNTAMAAINSYTLLDFMDEILENQPDAILIYAGHNEFYGALGIASAESLGKFRWGIKLYLKLKKYKTFLLLRDAVNWLRNTLAKLFSHGSVTDPTATLMERLVAQQKIVYGSPLYDLGKQQFKKNLIEIFEKAKKAGVAILIGELVSNIRDQKPFVSVQTENLPPADKVFNLAVKLEKSGRYKEASAKYYQAKDLDALRFRATEEFNWIIRDVAGHFQVPVVPTKSVFEKASPHGLIGHNFMLEHLHPNINGIFLLADAYFETMKQKHFIAPSWESRPLKPASYYRTHWGYTALDSLYGDLRIRILKGGWPFKPKSVPNRSLANYRPETKAESLAVKIWTDKKYTIERGHVKMAEYYKKRFKDYQKAFNEYNALIYLTPYNISPYLEGANALIKARDFDRALPILHKSLEVEESAYAYKWIGQIEFEKGKLSKALPFLEKAYKLNPSDAQLLYNLSGAYALKGQYKKANDFLTKLYKIDPKFPDADNLRRQLQQILKN